MGLISWAYLFTHLFRECHLIKWNEPLNASYFFWVFFFLLFSFPFVLIWNSFVASTDLRLLSHLNSQCFVMLFLIKIYINSAKQSLRFSAAFSCFISVHEKYFLWIMSSDSHSKATNKRHLFTTHFPNVSTYAWERRKNEINVGYDEWSTKEIITRKSLITKLQIEVQEETWN